MSAQTQNISNIFFSSHVGGQTEKQTYKTFHIYFHSLFHSCNGPSLTFVLSDRCDGSGKAANLQYENAPATCQVPEETDG